MIEAILALVHSITTYVSICDIKSSELILYDRFLLCYKLNGRNKQNLATSAVENSNALLKFIRLFSGAFLAVDSCTEC